MNLKNSGDSTGFEPMTSLLFNKIICQQRSPVSKLLSEAVNHYVDSWNLSIFDSNFSS